jgi:hypothetical protein
MKQHYKESRRKEISYKKYKEGNWLGHILFRNCFLKHFFEEKIEGMIEVTERRGRKCKQLLDNLKEKKAAGNRMRMREISLCFDLVLFVCLYHYALQP